jgi:hypothetical protein
MEGPQPGFHLIPPFAAEAMRLSPDQVQRLGILEQDVKAKLDKILSASQRQTVDRALPPRLGAPGPRGKPVGNRPPEGAEW